MPPEISNQEAIEMMKRCKQEIIGMRATIDRLKPKADSLSCWAYCPVRASAWGEDMVWMLDKRIRELEPKPGSDKSA